jgi:glycosyltransferase involved in cell wall biosynthesis
VADEKSPGAPTRVGHVIPEFPGQTHVWMWREIQALRAWGVDLRIFSTRRPPSRDRARHAFAVAAEAETTYLWPMGLRAALGATLWGLARPRRLLACVRLALTLPVDLRFRRLRLLALLLPGLRFARAATSAGVGHLHSHTCSNSAILCMMVKRLVGIPFSMTLNANLEWWGGAMQEKLEDADFTLAVSERLLQQVRTEHPTLRREKAQLGRIGVDTRRWVPTPGRVLARGGPVRAIIVARLHRIKAHDVLLDAMEILRQRQVHVELDIVGDGPERQSLEEQCRRLRLSDRVTFAGSLGEDHIIERMRRADLFVLPSRHEPLGVAYMEAMSMELPTIGTTSGGVQEIIDHGVDGLLVPPEDPIALADAIEGLVASPEMRSRLGVAGRRKIVRLFDSRLGAATLYERVFHAAAPDPAAVAAGGS